ADGHGVQRRYAAARQNRQRAREARRVDAANEAADQRDAQQVPVGAEPDRRNAQRVYGAGDSGHQHDAQHQAPGAHEVAERNQALGQRRQVGVDAFEYLYQVGYDGGQQDDDDGYGDDGQESRVEQGAHDFLTHAVLLLDVIGQALQ